MMGVQTYVFLYPVLCVLLSLVNSIQILDLLLGKISFIFLTLLLSWHGASYIWSYYLCLKFSRFSSHGKCVLITGCDSGFGHQAAIDLCDTGFTIFAGCLNSQSAESQSLKSKTKNASKMHVIQFNVLKDEDLMFVSGEIKKHTESTGEVLYGLVNNAGISSVGLMEWGHIDELESVLSVNCYAAMRITLHFIPELIKTHGSRVISITSAITVWAIPMMSAYGLSKIAFSEFMKGLRKEIELSDEYYNGMKAIAIEPSTFKTSMLGHDAMVNTIKRNWDKTDPSVKNVYGEHLYDGLISFIRTWEFFKWFDFLFIKSNLSLVTNEIKKGLVLEWPEKIYRVIDLPGRICFGLAVFYLPLEFVENSFQIIIYFIQAYFWLLFKAKGAFKTCRKYLIKESTLDNNNVNEKVDNNLNNNCK